MKLYIFICALALTCLALLVALLYFRETRPVHIPEATKPAQVVKTVYPHYDALPGKDKG